MHDEKTLVLDSEPPNRDPMTKEPGSPPIRTGIGAVLPGAAGDKLGEAVNPTIERAYWNENFRDRPYYRPGREYSQYEPAYRLGWESAQRPEYEGKQFDDAEPELQRSWSVDLGAADPWTDARDATRDAWLRVRAQRP
jgi:hypothetical protein